ncbi:fimbrial subunit-like cell surface protein [Bifidobacterium sp. DSM 109958]|uniref:Fimbrial subunit-like cell surface protein n=1 Tax=Bifidobacterium moraviense TaxID=2675323 RepID=A0A7Y0F112_9BIFI|nr:SpaA isopeptide-forming pilin-related protein [Bifidobacterium sp. DSM 109958]NMN00056.1 fimbrial subunit-like cell surface protein [Bifidobacterium sp. DSM 109958]
MRMKKLFAGLAAAATLLSGLALGAAPASAIDNTPSLSGALLGIYSAENDKNQFIINDNPTTPREFKYVKVADYKTDTTGNQTINSNTFLIVNSDTGVTADAVRTALNAAFSNKGVVVPTSGDPMTWVGQLDATSFGKADWKAFNTSLLADASVQTWLGNNNSNVTPTLNTTGDNVSLEFNMADKGGVGLYILVDQSGDYTVGATGENCQWKYGKIDPILIGTHLDMTTNGEGSIVIKGLSTVASGVAIQKQTKQPDNCTSGTDIEFQKTDSNGIGLGGAKFRMYKQGTSPVEYLTFQFADGKYSHLATTTEANADTAVLTSSGTDGVSANGNGSVKLSGLPLGEYVIEEIAAPSGYIGGIGSMSILPKFKLTVSNDRTSTTVTYKFEKIDGGDSQGLVTIPNGGQTATVVNVKSITELPKTGAAGTAIFTVIAVLIAGAAVTVYLKSRATKRQLMA